MMFVPLAVSPLMVNPIPPAIISLMFGAAVFLFVWTIWRTLATDDLTQDNEWRYDVNRINELRRISPFFRTLQPLVQAFARFNRGAFVDQLPEIGREIQAAGLARFWTAEEYLARIEIQALMLMPLFVYVCTQMMGPAGIVMAILCTILTGYLLRRRLRNTARYRLVLIKRRMPFLLDLVTLLMEAGSTFLQALKEAVDEFREHPVGVEFGRVLGELNMGKGRTAPWNRCATACMTMKSPASSARSFRASNSARHWRESSALRPMCCASNAVNEPKRWPERRR